MFLKYIPASKKYLPA